MYRRIYDASIHHFGSNQAARYNLLNGVSVNMTAYCGFRYVPHCDSMKISRLPCEKNIDVAEKKKNQIKVFKSTPLVHMCLFLLLGKLPRLNTAIHQQPSYVKEFLVSLLKR